LASASLNETRLSSRTLPPLNVKVTEGTGNAAKVRLAVVEVPAFKVKVSLNVESGVRIGATVSIDQSIDYNKLSIRGTSRLNS